MTSSDYISDVRAHDVLCGRGAKANNNQGNILFRHLIKEHKIRYIDVVKVEKPNVAREVVKIWRDQEPPGRFLMKVNPQKHDNADGNMEVLWYDVGDDKARMKASQCLRERTPDVIPYVKMLKKNNNLPPCPISISALYPNQFQDSMPTATNNNACLNPIGNGILPMNPSAPFPCPSYFGNYQGVRQLVSQDLIQNQATVNGLNNTSDYYGTGSVASSNADAVLHTNNNAFNVPTAMLPVLTNQQQQVAINMNLHTPFNKNNSCFPTGAEVRNSNAAVAVEHTQNYQAIGQFENYTQLKRQFDRTNQMLSNNYSQILKGTCEEKQFNTNLGNNYTNENTYSEASNSSQANVIANFSI